MTKIIGNIVFIEPEPDNICTMCGKLDELRPYGPNNSQICYDCAMLDELGAEIRMHKRLFNDDLTIEGARKLIAKRKELERKRES